MSRLFTAASSDRLTLGSAVLTSLPITMACWVYPAGVASRYTAMSLGRSSGNNPFLLIDLAGDVAGDPVRVRHRNDAATEGAADTTSGFVASSWQHVCGVFSATNSRKAFLNGGNSATNTTSVVTTTLNQTAIGCRTRIANDQYMDGRIAEAAIWNVALDDAEVAALAAWVSPLLIRPSGLVAYWPLIGKFSPEIELMSRLEMTVTGAVAADHAPTARPRTKQTIFINGATAYSLTAGQGSFSLSGQAAGLRAARTIAAAQGSFALSGQPAGLLATRTLTCAGGSFSISGQTAGLRADRRITAACGAFTVAGQDAGLVNGAAGTYTLTASRGAFVLSGQDAGLRSTRFLSATGGSYSLTGRAADLIWSGAVIDTDSDSIFTFEPRIPVFMFEPRSTVFAMEDE